MAQTSPQALPGLCPARLLPRAALTAAAAFGLGSGPLFDAVRSRRPLSVLAAVPLAVLGSPSTLVMVVFRTIELAVRRTAGQVRYDGRVLLTIVPHGGPRPRALVLVLGAAVGTAVVVAVGTVVANGLGALPGRLQQPGAAALALALVGPLVLRLPPRAAEKALRAHRDAHAASVVADLARARSAPPGAGKAAVAAYLAMPSRPPVVGLATPALWTKIYSPAGLSATAVPLGPLQARGLRRTLLVVHG